MAELPTFRYHPDPRSTGAVVARQITCMCCGEARDHAYVGPAYSDEELDPLCPWCIADGSAAMQYDCEFTDVDDAPESVPAAVRNEVALNTPGFAGLDQERWLFCCGDAATFLGFAGSTEMAAHPDAAAAIRTESAGRGWDGPTTDRYLGALRRDGSPRAYLFRCEHCGKHLAYSDFKR
jgi:uncharacterized protein CbrC (UPF0167 family)